MAFSDLVTRINAAVAEHCGDPGTFTSIDSGTDYECSVVLDDVTGDIETAGGPIEARPIAHIPENQIVAPQRGDLITIGVDTWRVDVPGDRDNGMWSMAVVPYVI